MTEQEYAKIVSRNLRRIAFEHDKSQMDIARDLKINQSTLSGWMNGTRTPKMSKIDMLCKYFNCKREDLMEPYDSNIIYGEKLGKLSAFDVQLISAYHNATESRQESVRALLGLEG